MGLSIVINRKDFSLISVQNNPGNENKNYLDAVAKTYFNAIERRRKVEKEASI
jgi:hypothetical protein